MKIRFLTSISGTRYSHKPGDVVEWRDKAEAERFIAAGYAEAVKPEKASKVRDEAKTPEDEKANGKKGTETAANSPEDKADSKVDEKAKGKGSEKADGKKGTEKSALNR